MAENYAIDGGPLVIVHENMKDVVIISPISTRTFQKYGSRFVIFSSYLYTEYFIGIDANEAWIITNLI